MKPSGKKKTEKPKFIRVVVADDSPFICRLLKQYLESDPVLKVIKTVLDGKQAMDAVRKLKPDVVTMDLDMPVLNGLEALEQIMVKYPTAVVLISGVGREAARMTSLGLSLGAVDFILKYTPGATIPPESLRREIIAKVKAAARIKVIRSIPSMEKRFAGLREHERLEAPGPEPDILRDISHIVVVGASTGGPLALKELLSSLNEDFPFPLLIVQHMPEGFTATMAGQFDRLFSFPVREAAQDDTLTPGTVLIAPGDRHLLIGASGNIQISRGPAINGHRPSIDVAMQSAAQAFGRYATGVLLSGMGTDGTQGLLAIRHNGGATLAQSKETCVINTMPESAVRKGIVQQVGSPPEIGRWLTKRSEGVVPKRH
jgi:two-component system chemotaxis response regulator CheB